MDTASTIVVIVAGIVTLPLLVLVHGALERCYLAHGLRYCRKRGLKVTRYRCTPWFKDGVKTEYSLVEFDCMDTQQQRRLVRLIVWLFGIHAVLSDADFPEAPPDRETARGPEEVQKDQPAAGLYSPEAGRKSKR